MYFVGIDWADQKHDIAIVDDTGHVVTKPFTIKKSQQGFLSLLDQLWKLSMDKKQFKIGIETPYNILVDFLVDSNYPVFSIFPGSMKSFRKRYRTSGARDDHFDAFVLANTLRTDNACWRKVDFGSDLIREIRILVRDHHLWIAKQTAIVNALRSTLKEYYPEYIHFFADIACACSLVFLKTYPDFHSARQLSLDQLNRFFKEHGHRKPKRIYKMYQILQQDHLNVNPVVISVKKRQAVALVDQLMLLIKNIKDYTTQIQQLLYQHPDHHIFLSYPGTGEILAARLLALFGDNRDLYHDAAELQAMAGTCPVTEKSGKNIHVVYFRRSCNKFYRYVMHQLAFSSITKADWAMVYYKKHRALNKKNAHALRCLANLHLKILFAMWKNKTVYNENIFLAQKSRNLLATEIISDR